ncbi:hypothetical protein EEX84_01770 [Planococcus salinus]|uniref:Uncharacterized protein n=1 Tax=Planococcus salinus TaxID=1848460 RepID=A0A3M8PBM0_9BACL|nr:hypothetical protein EEX84_01770 [Planococcus salinus]
MEQNSEDAQGTKRSDEIHSGGKPELAQREPPGKRSCFAEYRLLKISSSTYIFFINRKNYINNRTYVLFVVK